MSHVKPASPRGRKQRQRAIGRNVRSLPIDTYVTNIIDCYHIAVEHNARSWYAKAHEHAVSLSRETGHSVRTTIGVIAALSPSTDWDRNLQLARTMLLTGDCAHAYGDAIQKARSIRNGADPYDTLGGRKVRSFFAAILRPQSPGPVVIDRHAYAIATGGLEYRASDSERKVLDKPGVYAMYAAAYRSAARSVGIAPHDMQSITWEHYRSRHPNPNHFVDF